MPIAKVAARKLSGWTAGLPEEGGIQRIGANGRQHPEIASVERQRRERIPIAPRSDDGNADHRDNNADNLRGPGALAIEQERRRQDDDRHRRLQQQRVDSGRRLQPEIDQRVERRDAEHAQH